MVIPCKYAACQHGLSLPLAAHDILSIAASQKLRGHDCRYQSPSKWKCSLLLHSLLSTVRARLIRPPCQKTFIKALAHALHSKKSIIFDLAQSFSQPLNFVLFWLSHAFCPLFSGCRAGSHLFFDLAQNSAHPSKMCARTLHTLLAIN